MRDQDWIVGVDVGGTFTDAIAIRADGTTRVAKVPSTPSDPGTAFERALAALTGAGVTAGGVRMIFHGTTAATNALLTGGLARVVLATTEGFRDILGYRDGTRPGVYQLDQPRPRELVRRRDRIEVAERLSGLGETVTALREDEIDRVAAEIAAREPEAVAVAFLFSYLDDKHERALGEALAGRLPGIPVSLSSAVAREFREYPRTATAVVNAGLRPVVGRYLLGLRARVAQAGPAGDAPPLLIMQSNGGCVPAERAEEQAHRLVLSGPAAGVAGAAYATVGTQAMAVIIGMATLLGGRYGIRLQLRNFTPDWALMRRVVRLGLPASIEQSTRALGLTVMTFLVTSFGTLTIASYGIGTRILSFIIIPAIGISMATATLVAQNMGAGNAKRAGAIAWMSAGISFVVLELVGVLAAVAAVGVVARLARVRVG